MVQLGIDVANCLLHSSLVYGEIDGDGSYPGQSRSTCWIEFVGSGPDTDEDLLQRVLDFCFAVKLSSDNRADEAGGLRMEQFKGALILRRATQQKCVDLGACHTDTKCHGSCMFDIVCPLADARGPTARLASIG